MGVGSYRVRAGGGSFSEFMIVLDLRLLRSVTRTKWIPVPPLFRLRPGWAAQ